MRNLGGEKGKNSVEFVHQNLFNSEEGKGSCSEQQQSAAIAYCGTLEQELKIIIIIMNK